MAGEAALPASEPPTGPLPAALIALMLFLAPAVGATGETMLQDTLKSIVVSFMVLFAALLFFWQQRDPREPLAWHAVAALPLLLMAYALGSIAWSHEYLASVEAVRWFVFALLLWIGINVLTLERLPWIAGALHAGAVVAALWAALQFWGDFSLFPQGPPPASTFVNRNFFAEFAACTLPFGALLLARTRRSAFIVLLAASNALVVVAILMTGTRSALTALWVQLLVLHPLIAWRFRSEFSFPSWPARLRLLAAATFLLTVIGLGLIPSGQPDIIKEARGSNALERGFKRTGSISPKDESLGVRVVMWAATLRMIEDRPLAGVGAGAWENEVPLYQAPGSQLETDYYVHNEFLQVVAEYGVVGWAFLLGLLTFLLEAIRRTWTAVSPAERTEGAWRATFLCSLAALMIASIVGFPWRLASTGALFATCLAGIAASDVRLGVRGVWSFTPIAWTPLASRVAASFTLAALALAALVSWQAAEAERNLVQATQIALAISKSPDPNDPRWKPRKREMLALVTQGIELNPHYRKITPLVADELGRWGDWRDATWIWESVLHSRPHVVAIIANVARGYMVMGDYPKAREWLAKAKKIQPQAPSVRSLEVLLLARTGDEARALQLARGAIADKVYDFDMANTAFTLAARAGDYPLAEQAMLLRMRGWPETAASGLVQLGNLYATKDRQRALRFFELARSRAQPAEWNRLQEDVPKDLRPLLAPPQTSASKG